MRSPTVRAIWRSEPASKRQGLRPLSPARQALSGLGAWSFRRIAGVAVTDPMSGFFMIWREIVSGLTPRLSPDGFKILVDA